MVTTWKCISTQSKHLSPSHGCKSLCECLGKYWYGNLLTQVPELKKGFCRIGEALIPLYMELPGSWDHWGARFPTADTPQLLSSAATELPGAKESCTRTIAGCPAGSMSAWSSPSSPQLKPEINTTETCFSSVFYPERGMSVFQSCSFPYVQTRSKQRVAKVDVCMYTYTHTCICIRRICFEALVRHVSQHKN